VRSPPLGEDLTKRSYGWPDEAKFLVPEGVYDYFKAGIGKRGAESRKNWTELFVSYRVAFPELATEIDQMQRRELPTGWDRNLPVLAADGKGVAGREASGKVLNVLARNIPWFLGGSADLGSSNKTLLTYEGAGHFQADSPCGKNLHFGIREHAMAATVNGLSLSKLRPFGATFFIFSDYARPAIRLSALMELPTIFIFTHDAMGDGEDGPAHDQLGRDQIHLLDHFFPDFVAQLAAVLARRVRRLEHRGDHFQLDGHWAPSHSGQGVSLEPISTG